MGSTVNSQMTMRLFNCLFGRKTSRKTFGLSTNMLFSPATWSLGALPDRFVSNAGNQALQKAVEKLQATFNRSLTVAASGTVRVLAADGDPVQPAPTRQEIDLGVAAAGGMEALSAWLVDGKTKISVNGRKAVADVEQSTQAAGNGDAAGSGKHVDYRAEAAKSIARFGLDAASLDGDGGQLREQLKKAAAEAAKASPNLALAVEYALEDAFAKVSAWESSKSGVSPAQSYEAQKATNLQQAESVAKQLNLVDGQAWGVQSLAQDLAVFGMDLTAMSKNPFSLADEIKEKSKEMLAELNTRYVGTEDAYIAERNRITGASARLVNGLQGSVGAVATATASMSVSGSFSSAPTNVSVNGVTVNASLIIAAGNVIVDPLILDLNGDGLDLKSAEEGVEFDMDGDGQKTGMGFIRGDDAFLFIDEYGDGIVHDGRQLFGNSDGYANGFEKLRAYDENGDGVIDENDAIYEKLRVWQEKVEDGVCQLEETMSLREAGITSISLGYNNVRDDDGKGNLVGQTGSFTRADGSQGLAADVWLRERMEQAQTLL